jgi:aldehyde dehydrogenase (NAD+)
VIDDRLATVTANRLGDRAGRDELAGVVGRLRSSFSPEAHDIEWRLSQLEALERFVNREEGALVEALSLDMGKSEFEARIGDLVGVRTEITAARRNLKRWVRPRRVRLPVVHRPGRAFYLYEPLGTVLIIGPWNYPVYLTLSPLVGAIAAGCSAVLKPSELVPRTSALLAQQLPRYLDASAFAVVEGDATVTRDLIAQGFDHVFFTGSERVGRSVMVAAAESLTPVTLELGGKSPVVIAADADLRSAGRRIAFAKTANSGQTCVAPDYVLVEESVAEPFVESVRHWMTRFTAEAAAAGGLRIINEAHTRRLAGLLSDHGGRIALGGNVAIPERRVDPTIIVEPDPASALMQEEVFGPVLPVLSAESVDAAIDFIRRRPHPLAAYLFSNGRATQQRFIRRVHAGGIVVNQLMMHVAVPSLPFGGVGPSGTGTYHGQWGFETFSHRKSVLAKPSKPDPSLMYPPYTAAKMALLRRLM